MRQITLKYAGECRACGASLPAGAQAIYERRAGVWCPACAPIDSEDIRAIRQEAADRKADRYEEWAAKRHEKADALEARNAPYRGDIAFATQPGHIPERARAIARTEKAWEHESTAQRFEAKAERLRHGVTVAGDAETRRQARREAVRARIAVGSMVTSIYGLGTIERINRKTALIGSTGQSGTFKVRLDLSLITPF